METTSITLEFTEEASLPATPDICAIADSLDHALKYANAAYGEQLSFQSIGSSEEFSEERFSLWSCLRAIPFLNRSRPVISAFVPLQKWEGVVEEVDKSAKTFSARLIDRTSKEHHDEIADDIPLDDVDPDDWDLVEPGAVFYWTIGYSGGVRRQRTRASRISFQRIPISTGEFKRSKAAADEMYAIDDVFQDALRRAIQSVHGRQYLGQAEKFNLERPERFGQFQLQPQFDSNHLQMLAPPPVPDESKKKKDSSES